MYHARNRNQQRNRLADLRNLGSDGTSGGREGNPQNDRDQHGDWDGRHPSNYDLLQNRYVDLVFHATQLLRQTYKVTSGRVGMRQQSAHRCQASQANLRTRAACKGCTRPPLFPGGQSRPQLHTSRLQHDPGCKFTYKTIPQYPPTPTTAPTRQCEVLTGRPSAELTRTATAAPIW